MALYCRGYLQVLHILNSFFFETAYSSCQKVKSPIYHLDQIGMYINIALVNMWYSQQREEWMGTSQTESHLTRWASFLLVWMRSNVQMTWHPLPNVAVLYLCGLAYNIYSFVALLFQLFADVIYRWLFSDSLFISIHLH